MFGYIKYLNFYFEYLGCDLQPEREDFFLGKFSTTVFAILPYLFFKGIKQIGSFFAFFIYFLLYIPTIVTLYYGIEGTIEHVFYLEFLFLLCMSLIFLTSNFYFKLPAIPSNINTKVLIWVISAIITITMVVYYGSNLKLVGFNEIYDLRKQNDTLQDNALLRYLFILLLNAFIPLLFGIFLFTRNKIFLFLGIASSIFHYMGSGAKFAIFAPIIMIILKLTLSEKNINRNILLIPIGLVLLMYYTLSIDFSLSNSIFWYRALGIGGILNKTYYDFFLNHPYTYYSHINFVNFLTNMYPYGSQSLGEAVGSYYWSDEINANANFWATDGFAAFGDLGLVISSIILCVFFILFNSVTYKYNKIFVIIVTFAYLGTLLNTSLFSSFVTGGGLILCLLLSFSNLKQDKRLLNEDTDAV